MTTTNLTEAVKQAKARLEETKSAKFIAVTEDITKGWEYLVKYDDVIALISNIESSLEKAKKDIEFKRNNVKGDKLVVEMVQLALYDVLKVLGNAEGKV